MKHIPSILASLAIAASATAGTSAPSGKGKATIDPPIPECPSILNYSYLEAGYIRLDSDIENVKTQDGGYLDGSYEIIPRLLVEGSATIFEDSNQYTAAIGTYLPLCSKFHLTARAGYSYLDDDNASGQSEWYIAPGFRAQLGCHLELWSKVYVTFGEDDTQVSYGGGLTYHFCQHVGVTVGAAVGDDAWSLQAGLRYSF